MNISKAQIKHLRSLKLKKFREKYGEFVIEGDKLLREALSEQADAIRSIYALPAWLEGLPEKLLAKTRAAIYPVSRAELERISALSTPNKALAILQIPPARPFVPPAEGWSFYLDGLRDPGNVGTIWRIADWFGFRQMIISPDTADLYNLKVIQASMGAFLRIPTAIASCEELSALDRNKHPLWGADMEGLPYDSPQKTDAWLPPPSGLLVIGSEARGLSPSIRSLLSGCVSVPKAPHSRAESLNASVAAGILAGRIASCTKQK